jgi:single-strand selective monofunctional uracil DNA glycosylase
MAESLAALARELARSVDTLQFAAPISHVYNPLEYAWNGHRAYLDRFGRGRKRVLFLGMNPGPWGMAQTGVPFGEITHVTKWMGIDVDIGKPPLEHPKRPIEGMACTRSEVSGRRLWGLFADRFQTPERFFAEHLVVNYCPLVFMAESGRNITPDKLPSAEASALMTRCDEHLNRVLAVCRPAWLIGIGAFAELRFRRIAPTHTHIMRILHPSPASPAANRDWSGSVTRQLLESGVWR